MATQTSFIKKVITAGFFAASAALIIPTTTFAAEDGHGSSTEKGHKGSGGSDKGHKGSGGSSTSHGKSTIVGSSDTDSKGKKGSTTKAWSHDGMVNAGVDVELGRLNSSRAPQKVLDQQIFELLKNIAAAGQTTLIEAYPLYTGIATLPADDLNTPYDDTTKIGALANSIYLSPTRVVKVDSPLSNLALFKEVLLKDLTTTSEFTKKGDGGSTTLSASTLFTGIVFTKEELASIFLAVAADKEAGIELGTVKGVNLILGTSLSETQMQQIATDAAILQEAIVYNHDTTD